MKFPDSEGLTDFGCGLVIFIAVLFIGASFLRPCIVKTIKEYRHDLQEIEQEDESQ